MFGLNDNNTQSANGDAAAPPAINHSNPFADSTMPAAADPPAMMTHPEPMVTPMPDQSAPAAFHPPTPPAKKDDDLLGLKEQALSSLQPLVSHLDQSPEEKFKTTMMLIQATDNPGLVKEAYEAANQITDEKTRAQALLDVVNEINYFTQHNSDSEDKPQ
jgi:hypothetical protein